MKRMPAHVMAMALSLIVLMIPSCSGNDSSSPDEQPISCIDAHSQPPYPELGDNVDLQSIIQSMDVSNVSISILSARKEMQYSMDIASFASSNPERIIAAVSLKLTVMDSGEEGFFTGLWQQVNTGQFSAMAEMLLYHAEKFDGEGNSVAPERSEYPGSDKVRAIIDAARQLDCPVYLHIEFENLERQYGAAERNRYMNELEQLLSDNPDISFVLTHVAELSPNACRDLIEEYGNINFTTNFSDLAVLMNGDPAPHYSESDWNSLFEDHPDRFIFALERVFQSQWERYDLDMDHAQESLAKLSESVAQDIAYDNAGRLWGIGS